MSSTTKVKPKRKPKKDTTCIDEEKGAKRRKLGPMFGGALEEDIRLKTLPDLIKHGLDILFVGINPGLYSTHCGHYYVKKGNHFWPCITQSGLVPAEFGPYNDVECLDHGIGFSDMVKRCTRKQSELTTAEFEEGVRTFREKLKQYQPLICVFNGIQIYGRFSKEKKVKGVKQAKVKEGLQELKIEDCKSVIYVMPSSSPLTAHLPTPQHKMKYFVEIKELLRTMKGEEGVTSKYFNAQNGIVLSPLEGKINRRDTEEFLDVLDKMNNSPLSEKVRTMIKGELTVKKHLTFTPDAENTSSRLGKHISEPSSTMSSRLRLVKTCQGGKTLSQFVDAIKTLSRDCQFGDESTMISTLIGGLADNSIKFELLKKRDGYKTFDEAVEDATRLTDMVCYKPYHLMKDCWNMKRDLERAEETERKSPNQLSGNPRDAEPRDNDEHTSSKQTVREILDKYNTLKN